MVHLGPESAYAGCAIHPFCHSLGGIELGRHFRRRTELPGEPLAPLASVCMLVCRAPVDFELAVPEADFIDIIFKGVSSLLPLNAATANDVTAEGSPAPPA
mmetsp:Transcript_34979/g.52637  ORF Transcript_34979/g.52637 Transcript_34979/m.52637 type:complete len:101 (-) Transcript_34979:43-345(-)